MIYSNLQPRKLRRWYRKWIGVGRENDKTQGGGREAFAENAGIEQEHFSQGSDRMETRQCLQTEETSEISMAGYSG